MPGSPRGEYLLRDPCEASLWPGIPGTLTPGETSPQSLEFHPPTDAKGGGGFWASMAVTSAV